MQVVGGSSARPLGPNPVAQVAGGCGAWPPRTQAQGAGARGSFVGSLGPNPRAWRAGRSGARPAGPNPGVQGQKGAVPGPQGPILAHGALRVDKRRPDRHLNWMI